MVVEYRSNRQTIKCKKLDAVFFSTFVFDGNDNMEALSSESSWGGYDSRGQDKKPR